MYCTQKTQMYAFWQSNVGVWEVAFSNVCLSCLLLLSSISQRRSFKPVKTFHDGILPSSNLKYIFFIFFFYFAQCLQQYVALCRHRKSADEGFNSEFPHECFLVYFIDGRFIPIQCTQFFLEWNRKKNPCYITASCPQKDLPNQLTTQP